MNATEAESLLTKCPSWIGLNESHINLLQNFQDGFIRNALKLATSIPKALPTWDIRLIPMKWRIAQKYQKGEARNKNHEAGNMKHEARSRKQEARFN